MMRNLLHDESGFIVSAELVLLSTILVIGLIVGLSSIQHAVVAELNDVGDAIGSLNQSYWFTGFSARKSNWSTGYGTGGHFGGGGSWGGGGGSWGGSGGSWGGGNYVAWGGMGPKAYTRGSAWVDRSDDCDNDQGEISCDAPVSEGRRTVWHYHH